MPTISFNLLLDEVTERAVRTLWQELSASSVPAKGPAGYGPHITLTVYQVAETRIAAYVVRLPTLVSRQRSLPLHCAKVRGAKPRSSANASSSA